jgi:hypothetical protein
MTGFICTPVSIPGAAGGNGGAAGK